VLQQINVQPQFVTGTGCSVSSVTAPSSCYVSTCNGATGLCDVVPKSCNDNNLCTTDSCDPILGCQNIAVVCTTTDLCQTSTCDNTTGSCDLVPILCNDNINCTEDTCNSTTGCVFTPQNSLCVDPNPCVSAGYCNATLGCVTGSRISCNTSGYFCTNETCLDFQGCVSVPFNCVSNHSNATCTIYNCSNIEQQCVAIQQSCFSFGAIVGAIIGAGAGVGIAAAALLFLALTAGAAYAAATQINSDTDRSIFNNPLYDAKTKVSDVELC